LPISHSDVKVNIVIPELFNFLNYTDGGVTTGPPQPPFITIPPFLRKLGRIVIGSPHPPLIL
jgi:hypothetical protein